MSVGVGAAGGDTATRRAYVTRERPRLPTPDPAAAEGPARPAGGSRMPAKTAAHTRSESACRSPDHGPSLTAAALITARVRLPQP